MRLLKDNEAELIKALLMTDSELAEILLPAIETALVEDMDDGKMGSLKFMSPTNDNDRSFGKIVAEAEFLDEDKVLVCVALNLDNHDQLYELDVWKVDFSPVTKFPDLDNVSINGKI